MTYDIVVGRSKGDIEKYGTRGSLLIGKQYVHMGPVTSLSNNVYLDVAQSHVVFVVGKRGCLVGDTLVYTDKGNKKIQEITSKDSVMSYNFENNSFEFEKNVELLTYELEDEELIEISLKDRKIVATNEHPLLVVDKGKNIWKKSSKISKEEFLATVDGKNSETKPSKIINVKRIKGIKKVYDLTVKKNHSFVANGIVSHNSGKSYSMGVIAEGIATMPDEIQQNLSVIMLDTMGVYWTMKYPNHQDAAMLQEWKLEGKGLNIMLFTPSKFYQEYKEKGIPTDAPFAIKPSDVNPDDWCLTFGLDTNSREGILLSRTVQICREKIDFSIAEMVAVVENDKRSDEHTRNVVANHLLEADGWGIFSKEGTPMKDLTVPGRVSVLDMSPYATLPNGWMIKALVIGLISKKLFTQRMIARKNEEFANIDAAMHYFSREKKEKLDEPLVWIVVDEAHEVLPKEGKTVATDALVTILREGRQPGISLVLASQQPGKIHTDVVTQSDIVISHRLTAQVDVDALGQITQTYMKEGLQEKLFNLPKSTGGGVVFDDQNERIFEIKVRPRITWHGGSAPSALKEKD